MIRFISFLAISLSFTLAHADIYLTPADFGLVTTAHGRIDYRYIPSNLLLGNCDSDCYPDILRSSGNKLEVYLLRPQGYTLSQVKHFPQPIRSMRWDGVFWDDRPDLTVVLADGSEEIFHHRGGTLDLRETEGFLPAEPQKRQPPRRLSGFEFDLAWESEPRPCGMNRIAVGDLDNDGINELVTWWKETLNGDSAWILIYKCVGDNQYELFMEEPFFVLCGTYPGLSYLLIADLDGNGHKELIYTCDRVYIWEFYAPGVYAYWNTNYYIWRFVADAEICDVDQDGTLEIAMVTSNDLVPPTLYYVKEFCYKTYEPDSTYVFSNIMSLSQYWRDDRLDVGDFDNDGVMDIVSGNASYVTSYYPVDVQYYRYSPGYPNNFLLYWLVTGLPLSCVTPAIADLDLDGDNELYSGGLFPNGGSAFIWEATGLGTGYASWIDTTSLYFGANESEAGLVDGNPAVIALINDGASGELHLFGLENGQFAHRWESPMPDCTTCNIPLFWDMDQDDKMDLCMGGTAGYYLPNRALNYEQISTGINDPVSPLPPNEFRLLPLYPNPFNGRLTIAYQIPKPLSVKIRIFSIDGKEVYVKSENNASVGKHQLYWDASSFSSGVYLIRLEANGWRQSLKAVLIK